MFVMWETLQKCRLGLFKDSDFAGDLEDSKSTSGRTLCVFGSHTFVPRSWMCKKQTSVSHSSTEFEIVSLDAGLRLDVLLALELWDLIVSVLGKMAQTTERTERLVSLTEVKKMIIKGKRVPHWDMFPRPTELRLIGCSIELTWTHKSELSTSTPKTNSLTF